MKKGGDRKFEGVSKKRNIFFYVFKEKNEQNL